ncbi:MAG TPA: hypothetical protein VNO14_16565 [Blastocatellia bacterium]|nr:hypothetical protein [Blastocatellia bacterium]
MSLFCRLSRRHYWCTPHRSEDNKLIQVCYECGAERPARELHNEPTPEWSAASIASTSIKRAKLAPLPVKEPEAARTTNLERIAVGQGQTRKLALVK